MPGLKGAKADVAKAVQALAGVPAHWQAALAAEINAHPSSVLAVSAHFSQQNRTIKVGGKPVPDKGKIMLSVAITPLDGFITPGTTS